MTTHESQATTLRRTVSFWQLLFYGVGTILGAGIYVLINKIALHAGMQAPLAFMAAGLVAAFSAFSFAELSGRFPVSAGPAEYAQQAFARKRLSALIGWAVVMTGVVSAATIARGAVGYVGLYVNLPGSVIIIAVVLLLTGVAAWGIRQSMAVAVSITVVEVAGVLLVLFIGAPSLLDLPARIGELVPGADLAALTGIALAAFLAFYAFIGFEDMVNIAEEVKDPERSLPRAVVAALVITTVLYALVALVAVMSMPIDELAASDAPFADIVTTNSNIPAGFIGLISLVAVINGALIQIIMASRVIYGMASRGLAWQPFSRVNAVTRTPILATVVVGAVVLTLALWLPVEQLARVTSYIVLVVFTMTNLALITIRRRDSLSGTQRAGSVRFPRFFPYVGVALCLALLALQWFV